MQNLTITKMLLCLLIASLLIRYTPDIKPNDTTKMNTQTK